MTAEGLHVAYTGTQTGVSVLLAARLTLLRFSGYRGGGGVI